MQLQARERGTGLSTGSEGQEKDLILQTWTGGIAHEQGTLSEWTKIEKNNAEKLREGKTRIEAGIVVLGLRPKASVIWETVWKKPYSTMF